MRRPRLELREMCRSGGTSRPGNGRRCPRGWLIGVRGGRRRPGADLRSGKDSGMRTLVRWLVVVVAVVHGLLHLLGAVEGFGWLEVPTLEVPASAGAGW